MMGMKNSSPKNCYREERESIEDTASESYSKEAVETAAAIEAENGMDASEYILPDSDTRCLTEEDVAGLSEDEIRIALNEIYARHGRIFQSEDLKHISHPDPGMSRNILQRNLAR